LAEVSRENLRLMMQVSQVNKKKRLDSQTSVNSAKLWTDQMTAERESNYQRKKVRANLSCVLGAGLPAFDE
jgi:hypothetical protein